MPNIFNASIARRLNAAMGRLLLEVTLTKKNERLRPENLTGGIESLETVYAGRGFVEDYKDRQIDGTLVQTSDRKVTLLGGSIPVVPEVNDLVTVEGKTYNIVRIARDPAGATYECQVR